jgi:CDP-glycerol glycerophosphotransferase
VFSAYEEVLGKVRKLAESGDPVATPAVQHAVFERAIWHYSTVFQATSFRAASRWTGKRGTGRPGRSGLVPRRERRRFFERMHADFVRFRPDGYRLPAGARGAKFRLIERDAYRAYLLLEPLNKIRVAARRHLRARRPR